jgi:hypothetical protein
LITLTAGAASRIASRNTREHHPAPLRSQTEDLPMNDLERYFYTQKHRLIHKWTHYFPIYDRHFSPYRGTEVHLLEIGVEHGGSLQMWKHYFGPLAQIYGLDINPDCKRLEEERIRVFIGDQGDPDFLRALAAQLPRIDILIDDGGHTMTQQRTTFELLFPHVSENGLYVCEDLCTSYWDEYGGGYQKKGTFIEHSKNFIDSINAWHSRQPRKLGVSEFTRSTYALHYYGGILVIEKKPIQEPKHLKIGTPTVSPIQAKRTTGVRRLGTRALRTR